MDVKKVIKIRRYKAGYEVREELIDGSLFGGKDIIMKSAYNPNGDYIGNSKEAYRLCKTRGIAPETGSPNSKTCSIGWCDKDQKWFGWSHRAIASFDIGSTVKPGSCAYMPSSKEEFIEDLKSWYVNDMYENVTIKESKNIGITVSYNVGKKSATALSSEQHYPFPEKWGRGTWTAKTLADAKQMAIDFSDGVS